MFWTPTSIKGFDETAQCLDNRDDQKHEDEDKNIQRWTTAGLRGLA